MLCQSAFDGRDAAGGFSGFGAAPNDMKTLRQGVWSLGNLVDTDMGVSGNSGTPKSSILIEFSIINHLFWGTPIFGNSHMYVCNCMYDTYMYKYIGKRSSWDERIWKPPFVVSLI